MARIGIAPITRWITTAAVQHGDALADHLALRLGVSRRRAQAVLRQLVATQWLRAEGAGRRRLHQPGALRQVVKQYPLAGLMEDSPWRRDFAPYFVLPAAVREMARHAFTELVNNAIDHSGGTHVTVSMRQTPLQLQLLVSDDGVGLFRRLAEHHALEEPGLAMLELAKGKLTTAPDRHSGQGLFFTAQTADVFDLHANASAFQRRAWEAGGSGRWHAQRPAPHAGTSVYAAFSLDTPRTLAQVRAAHSVAGDGRAFDRTRVPLALLAGPEQALVSRAEARRVAARLDGFADVALDFDGVGQLGAAFMDELVRVSPPKARLQWLNAPG